MFEVPIAKAANGRHSLDARSESPFEQSLNASGTLADGNLHAAGDRRVGKFDSRTLPERARRQDLGEGSFCRSKSAGMMGNRLSAKFGGVTILTSPWPDKGRSGGKQEPQQASYTIALHVVARAAGVRRLVRR